MRRALLVLLLIAVSAMALAADTPFEFQDSGEERRFNELIAELRCLVCQNQSLEDSHAPLAQDLRREVLALVRSGATDERIKGFLTQRYGDFVLYRPAMKPLTFLLWFGPLFVLLLSGWLAWRYGRRLRAAGEKDLTIMERAQAARLLAGDDFVREPARGRRQR